MIPKYPTKELLYFVEGDSYEGDGAISGRIGRKGTLGYNFICEGDSTDHLCFRCPECNRIVEIVAIEITEEYEGYPEIYFTLYCNKCKILGRRKAWAGQPFIGKVKK